MNNNLFNYATKELSQDAFICWLVSFASDDAKCHERALVDCARKLLSEFIGAKNPNEVNLIEICRQYKNIDVLLHVEYEGEKYAIIVEDKVYSSEHDDQLKRYKANLEKQDIDEQIVSLTICRLTFHHVMIVGPDMDGLIIMEVDSGVFGTE